MINLNHAVSYQHIFWEESLEHAQVIVDATCGNGHDVEFLYKNKRKTAILYAIDIQELALERAKNRLRDKGVTHEAIRFLCGSHEKILKALDVKAIDLMVFNLGYLPQGDHALHTHESTTIEAVKEGLIKLSPNGIITIVAYPGSTVGLREQEKVEEFLSTLPQQDYDISKWAPINQKNRPPILYVIKGRKL